MHGKRCAYPDDGRLDIGAVIRVGNCERFLSQELTSVQQAVHANDTYCRLVAAVHDLAFDGGSSPVPGQWRRVEVDGSDTRCIQESLRQESSVGKQEQDVDLVVDQSCRQNLSWSFLRH